MISDIPLSDIITHLPNFMFLYYGISHPYRINRMHLCFMLTFTWFWKEIVLPSKARLFVYVETLQNERPAVQ